MEHENLSINDISEDMREVRRESCNSFRRPLKNSLDRSVETLESEEDNELLAAIDLETVKKYIAYQLVFPLKLLWCSNRFLRALKHAEQSIVKASLLVNLNSLKL